MGTAHAERGRGFAYSPRPPVRRQSKGERKVSAMTRKDLLQRVRQRPFAPFRLVLIKGSGYDVRHPDSILVARDSVVIGLLGDGPEQDFYETTVLVDRRAVEWLPALLGAPARDREALKATGTDASFQSGLKAPGPLR
jgi:hypothetical protein